MTTSNSPDWVQRYEDLRAHSVGVESSFHSTAWGLVLLIQQGMRGWMRAWQDPLRAASVDSRAPTSPEWPLTNTPETTLLLANMAMRSLASAL